MNYRGFRERENTGRTASHWLLYLAAYPDGGDDAERSRELDPQKGWLALHHNIDEFFEVVPDEQKLCVRGEDLLQSPESRCAGSPTGWACAPTPKRSMK